MDLSIFFAQVFGLYFLIAGVIVMFRQRSFMLAMTDLLGSRGLLTVVALCQLFAGLALVISHPIFTTDWKGLITFIGLWIVVEAVFYLALPYTRLTKLMRMFSTSTWFTSGGLVSIVLGAYLTGKGFGMW